MKDIKDTVKCCVQILEFIQKAKTKADKLSVKPITTHNREYAFNILDTTDENNPKWKTINIPDGNFFVYNDKYRGGAHVASWSGMMSDINWNYNYDYEDFSEKDVLGAFNTLQEAVIWMLIDYAKFSRSEIEEIMNGIEDELWYSDKNQKIVDMESFLVKVLRGEEKDKSQYLDYDNATEVINVIGEVNVDNMPEPEINHPKT